MTVSREDVLRWIERVREEYLDMDEAADAILALLNGEPHTVTTAEELRALDPERAPAIHPHGRSMVYGTADVQAFRSDAAVEMLLPATVLWERS